MRMGIRMNMAMLMTVMIMMVTMTMMMMIMMVTVTMMMMAIITVTMTLNRITKRIWMRMTMLITYHPLQEGNTIQMEERQSNNLRSQQTVV